jgi:acetyltransferase-like isoleucine patch superfamily enzyme
VGKNCKISSHTFICEGVSIGNNVFVGHGVVFINDRFPRAVNSSGSLKGDEDWECTETVVEDGASVGSGVTVLCGVTIGRDSIIGAGSVVTKDVPPSSIMAGNPAKYMRSVAG